MGIDVIGKLGNEHAERVSSFVGLLVCPVNQQLKLVL